MDGGTPNQPGTPWQFSDDGSTKTVAPAPQTPVAVQPAIVTAAPVVSTPPVATAPAPPVAAQSQQFADDAVEWTASEFVAHHKSSEWFGMLAIITVAVTLLVYFLTKDLLSGVVVIMLGSFAAYAANRQPHVLPYRLDIRGLTVGARFYPYNAFKSFYVVDEGAFSSITMMPSGGLMAEVSVYYAPEDEQNILAVLGEHLPMEQNRGTYVDRLVRRIRF